MHFAAHPIERMTVPCPLMVRGARLVEVRVARDDGGKARCIHGQEHHRHLF
jgi:hypothetical protein